MMRRTLLCLVLLSTLAATAPAEPHTPLTVAEAVADDESDAAPTTPGEAGVLPQVR